MRAPIGHHWLARSSRSVGQAAARRRPHYTAAEVMAALRRPAGDARAHRIDDCLTRLGSVLDEPAVRRRFRGVENYHRCLLRILTLYCRGWEADAIAAEISYFSTGVGIERAINLAAGVIADQLNRTP